MLGSNGRQLSVDEATHEVHCDSDIGTRFQLEHVGLLSFAFRVANSELYLTAGKPNTPKRT